MTTVEIVIQSLEDAANGKPIMEGIIPEEADEFKVGILEGGMQSGATSLMFICRIGKHAVCGQMSANNFEMLAGAVKGAVARFGGK